MQIKMELMKNKNYKDNLVYQIKQDIRGKVQYKKEKVQFKCYYKEIKKKESICSLDLTKYKI